MNIDIGQYSTQSGMIKLVFAIVGFAGWYFGKDISGLIPFYLALAGVQGVASKE